MRSNRGFEWRVGFQRLPSGVSSFMPSASPSVSPLAATPAVILPAVIELVKQAGAMLAAEFSRTDGPRFVSNTTAPVDEEMELFLRGHLTALLPARFVGEEAGVLAAEANGLCWVVDPHDGTRAFLEGRRGSAVSVALLRGGIPVLGVVYAPLCLDRGPDLIAWADGADITRNGQSIQTDLSTRGLTSDTDVTFLNHGAWQRPVWNANACAPGRFMPLPSIAYRLARVAVGDGIATVTLRPVNAHDIAAGHALLIAARGLLLTEDGLPVTYDELGDSRPSACFGGAPSAVATLRGRTWRGSSEPARASRVTMDWPRMAENQRLDRALGCMLGLIIGDSLGGQLGCPNVGRRSDSVQGSGGGPGPQIMAGQPTCHGELALALARSLVGQVAYNADAAAMAYARWYRSGPFGCEIAAAKAFGAAADVSGGQAHAARAAADPAGQSSGSLIRAAPIGVWAGNPTEAAGAATEDSGLSHPHPVCLASCAAFAAAIAAGVAGADRSGMIDRAVQAAKATPNGATVAHALRKAAAGMAPSDDQYDKDGAVTALHNAFFYLATDIGVEAAVIRTLACGGDTAGNAAVAGALLGAADGRMALPVHRVMPVLTCRPDPGLHPPRPRPDEYWPDDLLDLTEALLLSRAACGSTPIEQGDPAVPDSSSPR